MNAAVIKCGRDGSGECRDDIGATSSRRMIMREALNEAARLFIDERTRDARESMRIVALRAAYQATSSTRFPPVSRPDDDDGEAVALPS